MIYYGRQTVFDHNEQNSISRIILSEHETGSREEGETSFSHKVAKYLATSGLGDLLTVINVVLSVIMTVIHAIDTYFYPDFPALLNIIEVTLDIAFIIHFLLEIYTSETKLLFFFSTTSLIEYVSVIPSFLVRVGVIPGNSVFYLTRSLRFLVVYRMDKILARHSSEVSRYLVRLITTILSIMVITTCSLLVIENQNQTLYLFHDLFYFVVVTMATVGFGDVYPQTTLGQLLVVGCIFMMLSFIPTQTQQLARVLGLRSKFARISFRNSGAEDHIILLGKTNAEAFKNFLTEFYHPDHGVQDTLTVIMNKNPPSDEMNYILKLSNLSNKISFLEGNPLYQKDLRRAAVEEAKCVVILASKSVKDTISEDYRNILEAYAIKQHAKYNAGRNIRVCLQILTPESRELYYSSLMATEHDQVICVEELKFQLLAKTCLCPGISTIVTSLITSNKPYAPATASGTKDDPFWIVDYLGGMQNEIYRIPFEADIFAGITFAVVSEHIYKQLNLTLFALEVNVHGEVKVFLNPADYIFEDTRHYGYVIATNLPDISQLREFQFAEQVQRDYTYNLHHNHHHNSAKKDRGERDGKHAPNEAKAQKEREEVLEDKDSKNKVFYYGKITSLDQATITDAEDLKIENHIIICGIIPGMRHLLLPLRTKSIKNINPIIILHTEPMPTSIWKQINRFPKVYFMRGSPLKVEDLNRLSIHKALSVVILSKNPEQMNNSNATMADADTIFIYKTIKSRNQNIRIITELASISTISLLSQSSNDFIQKYGYITCEPFASGEIYISTMLDTLICQAYYNPYITSILDQMIMGGSNTTPRMKKIFSARKLQQSNLFLINVPIRYVDKTFQHLYERLIIDYKMIAIGLYRGEKLKGNSRPYVYLKPEKDVKLSPKDKIYVLSPKQPKGFDITDIEEEEKNDMALTISEGITANIKSRLAGDEGKIDTETSRELNKINQELKKMANELKMLNYDSFAKGLVKPQLVPEIRNALRKELSSFS